jgi:hypothetical protein
MSTCVYGHGDCSLLDERALRIRELEETVAAKERELRALRLRVARLSCFGPVPLRRPRQ